ncbi:ribulokinase [Blautia obeum]|uniref:FGGY-family carbohydrate kinase n=1 Tax=Blautia obeum TaxID=40520 RepID=UPI003561A79A
MEAYFMGIDTGTQGVRTGISDTRGKLIFEKEQKWETEFPKVGWAEQNPLNWWEAVNGIFEQIAHTLDSEIRQNIKACCVCATSTTAIPVDQEGRPLMNAMMWMDARSRKEMQEINDTGHPVLDYCGKETSFEWMIPKALWIKRHRKDIYDVCYRIVDQLDWMNYQLCGKWSSSICNTTCKWNYVSSMGGYQRDFFEQIGFEDYEEKLTMRVDKIGDPVGTIRPELSEKYGFSREMQIVQGGIDAHMAMFGLDVLKPGKLGVIMGTSFVHLCLSDEKPDMKGIWGPYDGAVLDNMWLLEGGQISASGLVNWFRHNFHIPEKDGNPYGNLLGIPDEIPIGADGVTVLDFFQGNRTPYKDAMAKGVIFGLNIKHTWKHIYRAVLESVSYGTQNIIRNFEEQGYPVASITACGGVTKDRRWLQMISDVTGKPIIVNENIQAGVLGCCVVAASKGRFYNDFQSAAEHMVKPKFIVEPDMKNHEEYQPYFHKYLELYESLKDLMHQ